MSKTHPTNTWDNAPKPWTRSQCRDRWVFGDPITEKELAKESGKAYGTLKGWKNTDGWVEARVMAQAVIAGNTMVLSEEDELDVLAEQAIREHLKVYKQMRAIASSVFGYQTHLMSAAQRNEDPKPEIMAALTEFCMRAGKNPLTTAIAAAKVAIDGERAALGLDYLQDTNKLKRWLNTQGYDLVYMNSEGKLEIVPEMPPPPSRLKARSHNPDQMELFSEASL